MLQTGFSPKVVYGDDEELVRRIMAAYRHSIARFEGHGKSVVWPVNCTRSVDVLKALEGDDVEKVRELLRYPARHDLMYGLDQVNLTHCREHAANTEYTNLQWGLRIGEKIVRLGEAMGLVCVRNPEFPGDGEVRDENTIEAVLRAIDQHLGFTIDFPNPYPDEFGLQTFRGVADHRSVIAVYQAWRLQQMMLGSRVLEIGAGNGRTAYYARKLGFTDYTIVDLPHANVAQANFLGRVLGPDAIVLAGEDADATDKIRICGADWLFGWDRHYDVVLNADSFPEMDHDQAIKYFKFIARRCGGLLSINHERGKFRVADLSARSDAVPRNYHRYPFWARDGYVEELFYF
jgi:SAM-dependent methyltransferase